MLYVFSSLSQLNRVIMTLPQMVFPKSFIHKYSPVNHDEEEVEQKRSGGPRFSPRLRGIATALLLVFTFLLGGILGFSLEGKRSFQEDVGSALKRKSNALPISNG